MNTRFRKFLCLGVTLLVINPIVVFAMENNIESSSNIDNNNDIIKEWREKGECLAVGGQGQLFKYNKYPGLVLKSGGEGKHLFDIQEYFVANNLKGKELSENLMYVNNILNNQNFVYEYIDGANLGTWRNEYAKKEGKLNLAFFIEKWCIGLFNAMEIFKNYNGKYKGDMKYRNIMVRKNSMIPVLVDFGDMDNTSSVRNLAGILLDIMKEFVPRIKGQRRKWDMLHNYLDEISKENFPIFDVDEIAKISDFKNNLIYQIENVYDFSAKEILNILVNIIKQLQNNKTKYDFTRPLFANCIFYKDDKIEIRQTSKGEYKCEKSLKEIIRDIVYEILCTARTNGMYGSKNKLKLIENLGEKIFKMNECQILEELKKIIEKK